MGAGKVLAIIGAILGLGSIALSFILPAIFGWYRLELSSMGLTFGMYFSGIGFVITTGGLPGRGLAFIELIGGVLVIIGAILGIIGAAKESKGAGIVGGILILLGPLVLIIDLLVISGADFSALIQLLGGPSGVSALWGSFTITGPPDINMIWGIWIGSFMALGGGVLGIIGGIAL